MPRILNISRSAGVAGARKLFLLIVHKAEAHDVGGALAIDLWCDERPVSPHLFVSSSGHRLDGADIRRVFYALSRQIGLRGPCDSHGPRLHDLRQHAESWIMPNLA